VKTQDIRLKGLDWRPIPWRR